MTSLARPRGRVVLVTGGTRGVGRGITEAFLERGRDRRHVLSRRRSERPPGASATSSATCASPEAVDALVDEIVDEHGRLDVLVNNAGGAPYALARRRVARASTPRSSSSTCWPRCCCRQAANAVMQAAGRRRCDRQRLQRLGDPPVARHRGVRRGEGRASTASPAAGRRVGAEGARELPRRRAGADRAERPALRRRRRRRARSPRPCRWVGWRRRATSATLRVFLASPLAAYVTGATLAVHGGGEAPAFLTAAQQPEEDP